MPDYHWIRRLGAGAFGEVWLTEDRAFGVVRAVKAVVPSKIHNPTNFYHEPQALKLLQHPNIVPVHDAGTLRDGRLYVAMDYVEKGSIEDVYKGAIVPLRVALALAVDICKGVEYIHSKGYVHRDIKPANALIGADCTAMVSDFGLCTGGLALGAASAAGYILHIAPEVIVDDVFLPESDVYAIGLTLYRMINGDSMLPSPNDMDELKDLIVSGQFPDRNAFQIFVPSRIRSIVRRSLSIQADKRYRSARELRHALQALSVPYDWSESVKNGATCWTAGVADAGWRITLSRRRKHYVVETERLVKAGKSLKVHNGCFSDSRAATFWPHVHRVFEWINASHQGSCPSPVT